MLVVFHGVKLLDVVGPAEVFTDANRLGATYQLRVASVDGTAVQTSIGIPFTVTDRISALGSVDTVMVAGGDALVGRPIDPALIEALKSVAARTRRLTSVCTGAFILAQAGLLSGRRATTHWRHTGRLARAYPDIAVEPDAIFVRDGNVFTSAGVSSGIDLALALVEQDHGAELAREVARALVVYLKRAGGQSQFSALLESDLPAESALRQVLDSIAGDPAGEHSVKTLAARASLSTRQLTRLFRAELGITPARYVETIRIDIARAALDAGHSVNDTARLAGFGSTETLRRAFATHLGIAPKAYRDRFRSSTAPRSTDPFAEQTVR